MRHRGFWDNFFDSDYRQRSDINAALDSALEVQHQVASVHHEHAALRAKVMQLAMTVDVLLDILEEHDLLDASELDRRVHERLHPPPPPPQVQSGSPYRDAPAEPPRPVATTTCTRCSSVVPVTATQITEHGVVCDRCMATAR